MPCQTQDCKSKSRLEKVGDVSLCEQCARNLRASQRDGGRDDVDRDVERERLRTVRQSVTSSVTSMRGDGSDCESEPEVEEFVIDELLTYCAYHRHNSSSKAILETVVGFYLPTEIATSKKLLWDYCGSHLEAYVQHKRSLNREAHVANADDIVKALVKLDKEGYPIPSFAAAKLDRVPRFGPEELDLTSLVMRVKELERQMQNVDSKIAKQNETVETLLDVQVQTSGYAAVAKRAVNPGGARGHTVAREHAKSPTLTAPARVEDRGKTNVQSGHPHKEATPAIVFHNRGADNQSVSGKPPANTEQNANGDNSSGDTFSYQRDQKRKMARQNRPRKNNAVFGKATASATQFTGAARTREIFGFNLIPETNENVLKSFFETLNVPVHELVCMSNVDARTKSFRVKVSLSDVEKVMDPEIWPESVGLRMFFRKRKVNTQAVNNTN